MKNTAYAFAADHLDGSIEHYATALARHFLDAAAGRAGDGQRPRARLAAHRRRRHARAATRSCGAGRGRASRRSPRPATASMIEAGVEDLVVMKTTRSAFEGFPRDRFTTLAETDDRLMATKITAIWRYGSPDLDFDATWAAVRATLLEVFADHDSPSVQTSIWIMAKAMLERHEEVDEVRMVLPNLHHWPVDLSPFGIDNDKLVYVATTEPHGLIEATVRGGASRRAMTHARHRGHGPRCPRVSTGS